MNNIKYQCPICDAKFDSIESIALHIAGKIKTYRREHISWAYENCSKQEVDEARTKAKEKNNINILADALFLPVKSWYDEKGKGKIGFKKQ